jgi:GGDEF domain-containing protein
VGTAGQGLFYREGDGSSWTRFKHDGADPGSLISDSINSILQDRSGMLWIGTQEGLDRLDPRRGEFVHFRHDDENPASLNDNIVERVKKDIALVIRQHNRKSETSVVFDMRWGGEEFLLLSRENNFDGACILAHRLLKAVNDSPFNINGVNLHTTISIGFCSFPLNIAKHTGRNRAIGIKLDEEKLSEENILLLKTDFQKAQENQIFETVQILTKP